MAKNCKIAKNKTRNLQFIKPERRKNNTFKMKII